MKPKPFGPRQVGPAYGEAVAILAGLVASVGGTVAAWTWWWPLAFGETKASGIGFGCCLCAVVAFVVFTWDALQGRTESTGPR